MKKQKVNDENQTRIARAEMLARQGCLYIVATPIGNREDISQRAIQVLKSVDCIAAEDTRHSQRLLQYYQIKTPCISLHEHNEMQRIAELLDRCAAGEQIALISDAGTPLISDPGARIVSAMHEANIRVVPIPGACALIAALCASGLPTDRFVFEGFLPSKSVARRQCLERLVDETRTMIFYESPHRIEKSLSDMCDSFGEHRIATIARELTKNFETIRRAFLSELSAGIVLDADQKKGEFVVLVEGATQNRQTPDEKEQCRVLSILMEEVSLKQAVSIAMRITGGSKKALYQMALGLKVSP